MYPQDVDLNIGDDITLTCSASGDPLPQISWEKTDKRTGERLMLSGSDVVALSNGNLPLVNVQQDYTGLYHCVASNRVDQIKVTAEIRVQGRYMFVCIITVYVVLCLLMCVVHVCMCMYVWCESTSMYVCMYVCV